VTVGGREMREATVDDAAVASAGTPATAGPAALVDDHRRAIAEAKLAAGRRQRTRRRKITLASINIIVVVRRRTVEVLHPPAERPLSLGSARNAVGSVNLWQLVYSTERADRRPPDAGDLRWNAAKRPRTRPTASWRTPQPGKRSDRKTGRTEVRR